MSDDAASPPAQRPVPAQRRRVESVDIVRGLVMVLMVLDHVRDHLTDGTGDPTRAAHLEPTLFFTRWVTHFCAPTFVLLAGTSAYFLSRRRSPDRVSRFLWTRGLWLIFLEVTVVRFAWTFSLAPDLGLILQVIWAIGASMIVLAVLVRLPIVVSGAFGVTLVLTHNLIDGIDPAGFGAWEPLIRLLHVPGRTAIAGVPLHVLYPLVPWVGVMAAGYALGHAFVLAPDRRASLLQRLGLGLTVAFFVLRTINGYGDPKPWTTDADAGVALMRWLATTKYPPSLDYLLMTLGPVLLLLGWLERRPRPTLRWLLVFGRVPLFLYVVHLYAAHALAMLVGWATGFAPSQFLSPFFAFPESYGVGLPIVLLSWIALTAALSPACAWYGGIKRRSSSPIFSYL